MGAGTQREDLHTEGTSTKVSGGTTLVQYVCGQYAMRNLGANSARPPVDKFTNFMVGRNPLVIERLLPHSKSDAALSLGASFFSPKILLCFY